MKPNRAGAIVWLRRRASFLRASRNNLNFHTACACGTCPIRANEVTRDRSRALREVSFRVAGFYRLRLHPVQTHGRATYDSSDLLDSRPTPAAGLGMTREEFG